MVLSAPGVAGPASPPSTRPVRLEPASTGAEDVFALPEAKVGAPYEYQIQTEGGLAPLVWRVAQGELPPGVRLEATGRLVGAPTQPRREAYRFDVEVSDSSQPPQTFSQAFSLMVKAAPLRIVTNRQTLRIINPESNRPGAAGPQAATPDNQNGQAISTVAPTPSAAPDSAGAPSTLVTSAAGNPAAMSPLAPNPSATPAASPVASIPSAAAPTPTPCAENCKIKICGRLRPASIDQSLSLIRNLPTVASALEALQARVDAEEKNIEAGKGASDKEKLKLERKARLANAAVNFPNKEASRIAKDNEYSAEEIDYLVGLWERISESRFKDDCVPDSAEGDGDQKGAVVALLHWLLNAKNGRNNNAKMRDEINTALASGEYSKLSDETIRKQIALLNQYIGNVIVKLEWIEEGGKNARVATTDRDGNFIFDVELDGKPKPVDFTLSTEADNEHTRVEGVIDVASGKPMRLNLPIEDRPVSLLVRSVVGGQQSAATASQPERNVFFDFFFRKSFPMRQRIDPDFGERAQLWSAVRVSSVPQPSNVSIKDSAVNFKANVGALKLDEVAQVFDYIGGVEVRLPWLTNSSLLPSFARDTKQKFSLSFIASYGFVTAPELSQTAKVYALSPDFIKRSRLPAERFEGKEFVAFVEEDRDRFFRQYYVGLRAQTFFFNRHNVPIQRFPAQFDIQWGQNEYVTGGRLHGSVLRFDGYFPLPYEKARFINLFGTAFMRPVRVKTDIEPLALRPVFTAENNGVFDTGKVFDPKTLVLGVQHFNRDYYKVGVGVDLIPFFQSLINLK
jgi:putative Ig domain-containing protein